ncbi:gamma-terpinene synthase, chloroplastic-like [Ziziphus jujuba]|uniref:Gamma-terpinene synthase, chloroplastic-like n=1 Tax=Ziziphus jujuba TaxID=326968 RepID=A0ABM4AGZ6_ZIZJJ|nr:gamma-terpinene synthase, chloroplastic-like [Ziziphus jujuba]
MAHQHFGFSLPMTTCSTSFSTRLLQPSNMLSPNISLSKSRRLVVHAEKNTNTTTTTSFEPNTISIPRWSAEYKPTIWKFDYIQSLRNEYVEESYGRRANQLKEEVRLMLLRTNPLIL